MEMKKCLVMAGGSLDIPFAEKFLKEKSYDKIIAVDAGLESLRSLKIMPDEIVGDLDSVDEEVLKEYENNSSIRFARYKPEKDETDMELALLKAEESGCDEVEVLGALGGRMDHALGNIQMLYPFYKRGMKVSIYDEQNCIYLLSEQKTFYRKELYGRYISFLPLTEIVKGITLIGFKYPLNQKTITLGTSLCISNELTGEQGILFLQSGVLCCIESDD